MTKRGRQQHQQQEVVADTVDLVRTLHESLSAAAVHRSADSRLQRWWSAVQAVTFTPGGWEECCGVYAQALGVATAVALQRSAVLLRPEVQRWLVAAANPLCKDLLVELYAWLDGSWPADGWQPNRAARRVFDRLRQRCREMSEAEFQADGAAADAESTPGFFERFLAAYDAGQRKRRGVFYTPRPIARFIVGQVDRLLREEFGVADGLADPRTWSDYAVQHPGLLPPLGESPHAPLINVLDPALGSGVFLEEVIDLVHRRRRRLWQAGGDPGDPAERWDAYVASGLLPRLFGLEVMLPACLVAHLQLADKLAGTGFRFQQPSKAEIHLIDTLSGPRPRQGELFSDPQDACGGEFAAAVDAARQVAFFRPMTVVVGNPPFSGISQTEAAWISGLLQGRDAARRDLANYYQVDDQELGERKLWLQDDYVKFLRYAHWKIERAGVGLIGLITNHGYLDSPSFRGVRYQLLRTFPRLDVIDLHGGRKRKEAAPDGRKDENVFAVEQGTAIGLFRRPPQDAACVVEDRGGWAADRSGEPSSLSAAGAIGHRELWGSAADKLAALNAVEAVGEPAQLATQSRPLSPAPPHYLFVPRDESLGAEYCGGYRLPDVMPVNVTAPVTARDGFVVAFERAELLQRLSEFRDLSLPDEHIRARYFTNTRSGKHRPGDTRGWKLDQARRQLAGDGRWSEQLRTCWYRPFDRRYVYWSAAMVDWPRAEVVAHLLAGPNLALIARRQMLPSQPCTYFWIVDDLTLDGVIRSDSRGSESLFPLYRYEIGADGSRHRTANLAGEFLTGLRNVPGLQWTGDGPGTLADGSFGAEAVLWYCYALFHSAAYRQRYADQLRSDFPRVFVPRSAELFVALAGYGQRLADAHLLNSPPAASPTLAPPPPAADWQVAPGYPRFESGTVLVNPHSGFEAVPQAAWEFHVGGHQVCRKWLKDRRGRQLSQTERTVYLQIIAAVAETLACMPQIDRVIARQGGWPCAFALR